MQTAGSVRSAADALLFGAPLVRLFTTALGRPPDPAELAPAMARLRAGDDVGGAAMTMVASAEFLARHGPDGPPDSHYLRALFWAIDGRDAPAGIVADLLAQPGATRASLLAQVSQSAPARAALTLERTLYGGALPPDDDVAYQLWLAGGGERRPAHWVGPAALVSILVAAPSLRPDLLAETLASLSAQTIPDWELLLVGSGGGNRLPQAATNDTRVRLLPLSSMAGAVEAARGRLVAFIDPGDQLAPTALADAAALTADRPGVQVIYTDEDRVAGDGTRTHAVLKSGWGPDLLTAGDALGQLCLFARQAVLDAGGPRAEAGPYVRLDLALRISRQPGGAVAHLPGILFHRGRAATGRPAPFPDCRAGGGDARLDAIIDQHLANTPGLRRGTRRAGGRLWPTLDAALPEPAPCVSIIIPTKDRVHLLEACMSGLLEATDYPSLEVLIVDNGSTQAEALRLLSALQADRRVSVLPVAGPFNWSALNNAAAAQARGDVLLLLNNDISIVSPDWLRRMVGQVMRPDVGVVGARLLFPDGRLQHGGVLLGPRGAAVHALTGADPEEPGYLGQVALLRDLSAVTGACLAIRRAVFSEVGGLDQEELRVAWSDIDLCLRVRAAGYRVLWDPSITLIHHEQATRGRDVSLAQQARHETERATMRRRWPDAWRDAFVNPALRATAGGLYLAAPDTGEDAA